MKRLAFGLLAEIFITGLVWYASGFTSDFVNSDSTPLVVLGTLMLATLLVGYLWASYQILNRLVFRGLLAPQEKHHDENAEKFES